MYIIHFGEKVLAEIGWLAFPTANKNDFIQVPSQQSKMDHSASIG
jgi:hypothetical protein